MSQFDRACRDFAMTYAASAVAMLAIAWQLALAGIAVSAFTALLPMILAGAVAGLRHAERTGQRPEPRLAWGFAFHGTAISMVFLIGLAIVYLMTLSPVARAATVAGIFQPAAIGMILAVTAVVHLLVLRYVFQIAGARGREGFAHPLAMTAAAGETRVDPIRD